jgi:hypothetical protein
MIRCVECGKKLGSFEGYRHPTLGKKDLVCSPCYDKVQQSVEQWREFIQSNSFNPESTESTLNIFWSSLFNRIAGVQKQLNRTEQKKNSQIAQSKSHREKALNNLNYHSNETLVQLSRKMV